MMSFSGDKLWCEVDNHMEKLRWFLLSLSWRGDKKKLFVVVVVCLFVFFFTLTLLYMAKAFVADRPRTACSKLPPHGPYPQAQDERWILANVNSVLYPLSCLCGISVADPWLC